MKDELEPASDDEIREAIKSINKMERDTYKNKLKEARLKLLEAQGMVGPMDERWRLLDEVIGPLEEMITTKDVV